MRNIFAFITLAFVMVGLCSPFAECGTITTTFVVASKGNDGATNTYNGLTDLSGTYGNIGKSNILGWRFEDVLLPQGAKISNATLGVFCNVVESGPIKIKYSGEDADDAAPLVTTKYDLMNRIKTSAVVIDAPSPWMKSAWNNSPDLATIVQEIVDRPAWQSGNSMLLLAEDSGSSSYRSVLMLDKAASYGAKLTITYDDNPLLSDPPQVTECKFDTNHDGIPDIILHDTDGDGYCELPSGNIYYTGTLVIDKPIEIMGANVASRTGSLLKGDALIITEGGTIASEIILHPEKTLPGGDYPDLTGLDFQIVTRNGIQLEYGGEILLGGIGDGSFAGDILLQTTREGATIFLKGDEEQEGTWVYGRNIKLDSGGSIYVTGNLFVQSNGNITLQAKRGDISLSRGCALWAGNGASITLSAPDGDINLTREVELAGDRINATDVTGNKNDDGTTIFIGTKIGW